MVEIERRGPTGYVVQSRKITSEGLVIHGYGGNKEEMLGLAVNLAERLSLRLSLFDLPGHGAAGDTEFNLRNALAALDDALAPLARADFFIGHSIGANLGLMSDFKLAVLLSMPAPGVLEARREELVRILRARRVRESTTFSGLREALGVDVVPPEKTLFLRAKRDMKSVVSLGLRWQDLSIDFREIDDVDHLDIVNSPRTAAIAGDWLEKNLGRLLI